MRQRRRGYSLFEVLVAFAIMTMALAIILPAQSRLLQRSGTDRDKLMALDWAQSHLDLAGLTEPLRVLPKTVTLEGWTLTLSAVPYTENLYTVTAEVTTVGGRSLATVEAIKSAP